MERMGTEDWTDDTLTEDEIRARWAAEGWEPVESLDMPPTPTIDEVHVHPEPGPVWGHSDEFSHESVRTTAA